MPNWKAHPFNKPSMNWKRGLYARSTAVFICEPIHHFWNHARILKFVYEWPRTRSEYNIFVKEVFKLPNFWPEVLKKVSFRLVAGSCDVAVKLAAFQYINGGTWSQPDIANSNAFKHWLTASLALIPTCFLSVPFENARRAYFADKL